MLWTSRWAELTRSFGLSFQVGLPKAVIAAIFSRYPSRRKKCATKSGPSSIALGVSSTSRDLGTSIGCKVVSRPDRPDGSLSLQADQHGTPVRCGKRFAVPPAPECSLGACHIPHKASAPMAEDAKLPLEWRPRRIREPVCGKLQGQLQSAFQENARRCGPGRSRLS